MIRPSGLRDKVLTAAVLLVAAAVALLCLGMFHIASARIDEYVVSASGLRHAKRLGAAWSRVLPASARSRDLLLADGAYAVDESPPWPGLKPAMQGPLAGGQPGLPPIRGRIWTVPDDLRVPVHLHVLATAAIATAMSTLFNYRTSALRQRWRRLALASMLACIAGLPFAQIAWSGPQMIRMMWEQVLVGTMCLAWVDQRLLGASGVICCGSLYVLGMVGVFRLVTSTLRGPNGCAAPAGSLRRPHTVPRLCPQCDYEVGSLVICPECGADQSRPPSAGVAPGLPRAWFRGFLLLLALSSVIGLMLPVFARAGALALP